MTDPAAVTSTPSCRISVVIPNLDGAHWLQGCLATLQSGETLPLEIVVADDGSSDESREICERLGARFVSTWRARTGFAATANRGIRATSGECILLLNNDTEVTPTTILALADALDRHPDAAMIAPLVLSLRHRETVDSAGMLLFPDATARPRWHGERVQAELLMEESVLVPSGAAAVFRRTWLERVGLLDEGMTSYLEDIDLGLRIRRAGGSAVFIPGAVVFHYFSGTTGALGPMKARFIERNHVTVAARHLPLPWLIALPFWTLVRWGVLVQTVLTARTSDGDQPGPALHGTAFAVVRGAAEGIVRLPRSLADRRRLKSDSMVGSGDWRRLLAAHRARAGDYRRFGASFAEE